MTVTTCRKNIFHSLSHISCLVLCSSRGGLDFLHSLYEKAPERKANKQGNFVAGKAGNLALYEDEIQKRPRISTLLESLSRYEAVLSPQQDDEEGEAKTAKSSQVRVYKKVLYRQNKAKSSCVFILVMQILSYGFENILNY
ncbi:uncharacterized protein LOC110048078 isoform X2 [Orbicella faveolata]|uniref:uncharacterized protein LOC110048078 isoform X2 n=1 Tax=Orbicella faveolata TaxID=48498 RepID=UPI0009E1A416|nr:uncharacterized protein LOC110048078 isoform X2 [Orbicella faveolata]